MDDKQFKAILILIVPRLVKRIEEEYQLSTEDASKKLYTSKLYSILEREDTKFWHYSVETLFSMFDEEIKTGKITFPDVV